MYEPVDFHHKVGDTFSRVITVQTRASDVDPWSPVDLTGYEVVFGVALVPMSGLFKEYNSEDAVPYVWVHDAANGVVHIKVPGEETRTWWEREEPFTAYEVTLIAPNGDRMTISDGALVLRSEVVRDSYSD